MIDTLINILDWNKMDGLIPAIVQHATSGEVLMLAYMNKEALMQTHSSQFVTFFSRKHNKLWMKGETSGNKLEFVSCENDCDNDCLLVQALPQGPVCHLGNKNCFDTAYSFTSTVINELESTIRERASSNSTTSYTKQLLESGIRRMAQKVGEEGVETALAAVDQDLESLLDESADLIYHLLVLLHAKGCDFTDVSKLLAKRMK